MAFFDIGNRRKQQEGRRNAGVMGQGLGRGLQMLQQGQRPGGMGADYREKLARMREMQGSGMGGGMQDALRRKYMEQMQRPDNTLQPVGAGIGAAMRPQNQQYSQADMMRKQAMYRQQQEQRGAEAIARNRAAVGPVGALGSREDILRAAQERGVAGPMGGMGGMAYDQPRMNPYTQRQRALAAMQQRAAQPRQRGNTSAGVFRKMMLERARKRQMRDQRMQRNRFNPFMNR